MNERQRKDRVAGFIGQLKSEKPLERRFAIDGLVQYGGKEVIPHFLEALNDENNSVINSAITALGETKDPSVIKPILDILDKQFLKEKKLDPVNFWRYSFSTVNSLNKLSTVEHLPFLIEEHSNAKTPGKKKLIEDLIEKIEKKSH